MKKYIKNYLDYFGYGEQDFIPSEVSGRRAADIHHVVSRSAGGTDNIENLIALTREEHDRAHFRAEPFFEKGELQRIHDYFMAGHRMKDF